MTYKIELRTLTGEHFSVEITSSEDVEKKIADLKELLSTQNERFSGCKMFFKVSCRTFTEVYPTIAATILISHPTITLTHPNHTFCRESLSKTATPFQTFSMVNSSLHALLTNPPSLRGDNLLQFLKHHQSHPSLPLLSHLPLYNPQIN
jgi:hypothetical protein